MAPISRSSSISNKRRRIDTSSEELEELPVTSPRKTRLRKASLPARLTSSVRDDYDDYDDDEVDGEGEDEDEEDDEAEPELEHSHSHSVSIEGEEAEGEEEEQEQEQEDAEWQEKYKIWEMFADEYHDSESFSRLSTSFSPCVVYIHSDWLTRWAKLSTIPLYLLQS